MGKKDGIAPGKKRVMLTLTTERVERLQSIFKDGGLPAGMLSSSVDDFIKGLIGVMEGMKGKESFTVKDYFQLAGEQLELIQEREVIKNEKSASKTKGVVSKPGGKLASS